MRNVGRAVLAVNNPGQLVRVLLVVVLSVVRSPGISGNGYGEKKENDKVSH